MISGAIASRDVMNDSPKSRVRALRRSRRYLAANKGTLARLLNTYAHVAKLDPTRRFLPDQ